MQSRNQTDPLRADPFYLFVESVQDYAIFLLDVEGKVKTWNAGAERIKGYKSSEIIGRHFSCFYTDEDITRGIPQQLLNEAASKGKIEYEGWRVRKDGSRFWANVVLTAIRDDEGKLIGFGKVTRDLTERMLAQKALETSKEKLEESERSLRELSLHLLRVQDEERRLIGREMHDSLGQILSVLKIQIESLTAGESNASKQHQLSQCANLIKQCVNEVRTVSYLLYPPMLEEMGLGSAIPWYLEGFSKRSGITVIHEIPKDFGRVPRDIELALFRVVQEGLTNVHKHSGSQTAMIRLTRSKDRVVLELTDQGKGFPWQIRRSEGDLKTSQGIGLRGMDERLRQLSGELEVISGQSGTQLRATVPLGNNADRNRHWTDSQFNTA